MSDKRDGVLSQLRRRQTAGVGAARAQQRELERRIYAMNSVRTQQHLCVFQVQEIVREWQTLLAALSEREYQLHGQFQRHRFGKVFDESVDSTRKWVHNMQGPERCFGSQLDEMLDTILSALRIGYNMQHWREYLDAGKTILASVRALQYAAVTSTTLNTQKDNLFCVRRVVY